MMKDAESSSYWLLYLTIPFILIIERQKPEPLNNNNYTPPCKVRREGRTKGRATISSASNSLVWGLEKRLVEPPQEKRGRQAASEAEIRIFICCGCRKGYS